MSRKRCRLRVRGLVQGVGFRPFVYRTAETLGLAGSVRNTELGVTVEVEGPESGVREFAARLRSDAPPLARVDDVAEEWLPPAGLAGFEIAASRSGGEPATVIPPDVAVCGACLRELGDPSDRRHGYAFINCTDCGPRFTLIEGVPYDRARTTMRAFTLCGECRAEYENPRTRRFHAEPNACPRCGPRVWVAGADGRERPCGDPIGEAARRLAAGEVVAVKGIGGFHLAADAAREDVVARLRRAKQRDRKPFAVMAEDATAFALVDREEDALLRSPARPIVLLRKREPFPLAESVAPDNALVGAMLPYSPLHYLLLRVFDGALVMTSANPNSEPIARDNQEAAARLAGIADSYLFHDREILARADDSVVMHAGATRMIRRSRGYTPLPVTLPVSGPPVVAVGGDLKNVFCVTRGDEAFLGPYVGDLENAATAAYFDEAVAHLCRLLEVRPEAVVHDLHPDYVSTRLARRLSEGRFAGARRLEVQHHHAHVLSCLAENGTSGPALGWALDGAGYGPDGTSWGGELLRVDGARYARLARLETLPLPGGDLAVREPWRIAVAALSRLGQGSAIEKLAPRWPHASRETTRAIVRMIEEGAPLPQSSGLGRLFDAVSAIAGVRDESSYEGEAAIALEHAAGPASGAYPYRLERSGSLTTIATGPTLEAIAADAVMGEPAGEISARFHATVVQALLAATTEAAEAAGLRTVALSGGATQNRILLAGLVEGLTRAGFSVLTQSAVPANDGGIALGQALAALLSTGSA